MSKPFIRAGSAKVVDCFTKLLPSVDHETETTRKGRLGRTAEGLHRLQVEAREEGLQEGRGIGFEEGRAAGFQSAREEMAEAVDAFRVALERAASRIEGQMDAWYRGAEQNLSELSVAIAARILGQELALERDTISALVRQAVSELATAEQVRIRVHPFDAPTLEKEKALVLSANAGLRSVEIVDDPSITGGARIESDSGVIDATIQTQLDLAFRAIRDSDAVEEAA